MSEPGGGQAAGQTSPLAREAMLARVFVRLADTLADDFDLGEFVHGLSVDAVEILGAEAAGVMLADQHGGGLRLAASSEDRMRALELLELKTTEGPCLDAFASGRPVQASAADSLGRWPAFAPQASEAGFGRMCGMPLRAGQKMIGVLNLFHGNDEPVIGDEMAIAQAMADVTAIALTQAQALRKSTVLTGQLEAALASRIVIEQAKGMLAQSFSMPVNGAFHLIRRYARQNNRKLAEVAADIINQKITSQDLTTQPGRQRNELGRLHAPRGQSPSTPAS
jgi:GAF domain-containing protein